MEADSRFPYARPVAFLLRNTWSKYRESLLHPILGGDFVREEHEDWTAYVHRTAQLCRQVLKGEQERWDAGDFCLKGDPDRRELTLYFCLTAVSE
jgi:hypothetical protein